jgi:DNA-binding CsgD family transcriptional regulator
MGRVFDVPRLAQQLLGDAQASPHALAFRQRALELLDRHLGFESAIFLSGARLAAPPAVVNKPHAARFHRVYLDGRERYVSELRPGREAARAQGGAYVDTEVFSAAQRARLAFYRDVIRPQGITGQLIAQLEFRGQRVGAIHLCRHDGIPFNARQRDRLVAVLPALTLAHVACSGQAPLEPDGQYGVDLSPRERQIAAHLCQGLRTREIAEVLGTSPHTVRNQLQRLYEKTGTVGRTELVLLLSRGAAHPLESE